MKMYVLGYSNKVLLEVIKYNNEKEIERYYVFQYLVENKDEIELGLTHINGIKISNSHEIRFGEEECSSESITKLANSITDPIIRNKILRKLKKGKLWRMKISSIYNGAVDSTTREYL